MRFYALHWNGARSSSRVARLFTSLVLLASLTGAASAAGSAVLVSDTFSRYSGSGWLAAEHGGSYRHARGSNGFDVTGGVGRLALNRPGVERLAELPQVATRDVNLRFRFNINRAMSGAKASVVALVRFVGAGDGYEARLRIREDRSVWVSVSRKRHGVVTLLGSEQRVPRAQLTTIGWHWLRVRVTGAHPTRLQAKLWATGMKQPRPWQIDLTDSDDLAAPGGISVGAQLSRSTLTPVQFQFDDLRATTAPAGRHWSAPPASQPAASTLRYVPTPQIPMPDYLASIIDPTWETQVTRIYNVPGVRNTYSRRQAWNKDGTMLLLGMGGTFPRALLDGRTYAVLNPAVAGDGIWSETDPSVLIRASTSTGDVFTYDPLTNTRKTTIVNLSHYNSGSILQTMSQSSIDDAGRYLLLYGATANNQRTVLVLDMVTRKVRTLNVTTKPHAGSISHSGRYVAMNWDIAGTAAEQGMWLYDINLNRIRQIAASKAHGDFATDTAGREVLVYVAPGTGAVKMHRLSDGVETTVLGSGTAMMRGHISGRNNDRPGWVYCSIYDSTNTSTKPGADQVFALKLDGSQEVEVFAHAHHGVDAYAKDPLASVSRDGMRVIFGSEWYGTDVYAYVAQQLP